MNVRATNVFDLISACFKGAIMAEELIMNDQYRHSATPLYNL